MNGITIPRIATDVATRGTRPEISPCTTWATAGRIKWHINRAGLPEKQRIQCIRAIEHAHNSTINKLHNLLIGGKLKTIITYLTPSPDDKKSTTNPGAKSKISI